jgi:hypothetical protein
LAQISAMKIAPAAGKRLTVLSIKRNRAVCCQGGDMRG